jgi:ATP-dependent helicase/nuclease subunit A
MTFELTPEQLAAVESRDTGLFVHANAGSGKTRVLVERFVRAVVEDDVPVDRMLAITFTEKAAAELRARIRRRFLALGHLEAAREAEATWISTIHGLCSKLLRRHALAAGIDPEYEVFDETRAARLAIDAFDRALEEFLEAGDPARLDLAAAHTPDRLRRMVTTVHAKRRSAGEERPELPEIDPETSARSSRMPSMMRCGSSRCMPARPEWTMRSRSSRAAATSSTRCRPTRPATRLCSASCA